MRRKPHAGRRLHGRPDGHPWRRNDHDPAELARALVAGRVAGPETSHDRRNVRWKIERLCEGDADLQFGIRGLAGSDPDEVLRLMADAAGFDPDPDLWDGPTPVDPWKVLTACDGAGGRLALAAEQGERVLLATGHPAGLPLLYAATGELLVEHGAKLLRPLDGESWREDGSHREIRYFHGVAALTSRAHPLHTHRPEPMQRLLEDVTPDLVFADHGFAGAAIDAGIDTISIVDVNDPAPVVARSLGRTERVIAMDDNVRPEAYWPCFQAIAARFPAAD